jgi:hypothetical protein
LQILRDISNGVGMQRWQAQGLTDDLLDLIRSFDYSDMLPEAASAIFWYVRNSLFFNAGLESCDRVLPLAYEDLVSDPATRMRGVCKFVGGHFRDSMVRDVHAKSIGLRESKIPPDIQALCAPLYERLHDVQRQRWRDLRLDDPA